MPFHRGKPGGNEPHLQFVSVRKFEDLPPARPMCHGFCCCPVIEPRSDRLIFRFESHQSMNGAAMTVPRTMTLIGTDNNATRLTYKQKRNSQHTNRLTVAPSLHSFRNDCINFRSPRREL